jgi:uncharacterized membrane protein
MYETNRPDIKPEWSIFEKILQIVCILILVAFAIQLVTSWGTLPKSIPSHFNAAGVPDAWGGKSSLLLLPIMGLVMYTMLTIIERFPKIFNFPFEITEKNARYEYQTAREMLVCIKAEMLLIFGYIQWDSVEVAKGTHTGLGSWFLTIFLVLLAVTMIYYIRRMNKHKNGD